ncbi:MAG: hybrid sensor histidine kinase/response regulator [Betaproteobacteria bacterium]
MPFAVRPGVRGSVRRKTMMVVLITTVIALAVNGAALFVYEVRAFREGHLTELRTQAEIVGRAIAPAVAFRDAKSAAQDLAMLRARADIDAAAVYGPDGRLFAAYQRQGEAAAPPVAGAAGHRFDADRVVLFHPIVEHNETVGTVYLRGRSGMSERVAGYVGILGGVMALALGVAWLLSAWLQRAITRPIQAVAEAASEVIERRDLSVRARKLSEDEIGMLADALNRMLGDLEHEMSERRGAEAALKAADRRKDEFLATLAHELRNPLAPIRNALYILQAAKDPAAGAEARAIIERQLAQLVRLVDDLLDVSRITTGKLVLRRQRVDVRAAAKSALEAAQPMIRFRALQLQANLPPEGVTIDADPTRLSQILLNLLNNAIKFTDSGGHIWLRAAVAGGELVASVRDDGIGLAAEPLEEIFDMFAQVDRSLERTSAGLGVGLSLSRRLAELHGGTLEAKSAGLGKGAEFVLRIPLGDGSAAARATPPQRAGEPKLRAGNRRVLIADDNVDFAETLAFALTRMGNEVRVAHDGASALAAASEFRPDIAFLDIGLPRLNGFDLARRLRTAGATAHATLVAVTGWGQDTDRQLAREAGFDEYMVKPVEMERVQAILRAG